MQIKPSELSEHLKRSLKPIYIIAGEDYALCRELRNRLYADLRLQGYTDVERFELKEASHWQVLSTRLRTLSLFSNKRVMDCRLLEGKVKQHVEKEVNEISNFHFKDTILVFWLENTDNPLSKLLWFQNLTKKSNVGSIFIPAFSPVNFSAWLKEQFQVMKLPVTKEALVALQRLLEGNISASLNALQLLSLYYKSNSGAVTEEVTEEVVVELIAPEAEYGLFDLVRAAEKGDFQKMASIFSYLKNTEIAPLLLLWALTKETRRLIQMKPGLAPQLYNLLAIAKKLDAECKTSANTFLLQKLYRLYLHLAGVQNGIENNCTIRWYV